MIRACAETIAASVETVRALVDEFSVLARFPLHRSPQPNNPGRRSLSMFNGRLEGIPVQKDLLPAFRK